MPDSLLLIYHPNCLLHETGQGHPERPDRLRAVWRHLDESGFVREHRVEEPQPAAREIIALNHSVGYIDSVEAAGRNGYAVLDAGDTVVMAHSYRAACLAVGGMMLACDRVVSRDVRRALALPRPPGHHAEFDRAMGFCLFNSVAIAAHYLREHHQIGKIAIIDWDVHHGNGTQNSFYTDPSVLYISIHQHPLFPGTGAANETGAGAGLGATLNIPVAAGIRDDAYHRIFEDTIEPAIRNFHPEMILISAGFDAHQDDPIGEVALTTGAFGWMTEKVCGWADEMCEGRVISLLEGGYHLRALSECVLIHAQNLSHL